MKKLTIILLLTLFAVGFTSCAADSSETDPVIPEVQIDNPTGEDEEEEGVRTWFGNLFDIENIVA